MSPLAARLPWLTLPALPFVRARMEDVLLSCLSDSQDKVETNRGVSNWKVQAAQTQMDTLL